MDKLPNELIIEIVDKMNPYDLPNLMLSYKGTRVYDLIDSYLPNYFTNNFQQCTVNVSSKEDFKKLNMSHDYMDLSFILKGYTNFNLNIKCFQHKNTGVIGPGKVEITGIVEQLENSTGTAKTKIVFELKTISKLDGYKLIIDKIVHVEEEEEDETGVYHYYDKIMYQHDSKVKFRFVGEALKIKKYYKYKNEDIGLYPKEYSYSIYDIRFVDEYPFLTEKKNSEELINLLNNIVNNKLESNITMTIEYNKFIPEANHVMIYDSNISLYSYILIDGKYKINVINGFEKQEDYENLRFDTIDDFFKVFYSY